MRPINTKELADQEIIALVTAFDRQGLPLNRRFEGDDDILRDFTKSMKSIIMPQMLLLFSVFCSEKQLFAVL